MAQTISSDQYSQPEKLYGAAAPWRGIKLPFVFLLCIAGGLAQEKSPSFMVRTVELRDWKYTCTVLTEDGRLRREVSRINQGHAGRADVFEGIASKEDMEQVKALINDPNFQSEARNHKPRITIAERTFTVEADLHSELLTVTFADRGGKGAPPPYIMGFLRFSDEVANRNLPKVSGKVEMMCRPLTDPNKLTHDVRKHLESAIAGR